MDHDKTEQDAARRYAQLEGGRDYQKRRAERLEAERDEMRNMLHNTCETLGAIQGTLGTAIVGTEPQAVEALAKERDALAAHAQRLHEILLSKGDDLALFYEARARAVVLGDSK